MQASISLAQLQAMRRDGDLEKQMAVPERKRDLRGYVRRLLAILSKYEHAPSFKYLNKLATREDLFDLDGLHASDGHFWKGLCLFHEGDLKLATSQFARCDKNLGYAYYMRLSILLKRRGNFGAVRAKAVSLLLTSADMGCPHAFLSLGKAYLGGDGDKECKVDLGYTSYRLAAVNFLRGDACGLEECSFKLRRLKKRFPEEIAPFGDWSPDTHPLFPIHLKQSVVEFTQVAFIHLRLPREITMMIISFAVTSGGW